MFFTVILQIVPVESSHCHCVGFVFVFRLCLCHCVLSSSMSFYFVFSCCRHCCSYSQPADSAGGGQSLSLCWFRLCVCHCVLSLSMSFYLVFFVVVTIVLIPDLQIVPVEGSHVASHRGKEKGHHGQPLHLQSLRI